MNWMGPFQQLGRSLMLPMTALPAAAILLFAGNAIPWTMFGLDHFGQVLIYAGDTVFAYLPYLFAVGVAMGLTDNASSAALTSLLSYFLFTRITVYYAEHPLQIGVSGAIMIGLLTAVAYNRLKHIKLPEPIQFFGGPRFVPLFMSIATMMFSYFFAKLNPRIEQMLDGLSDLILNLEGFGVFLYGVLHRLLVPTGLHHILNNVMWFQVGSYERADGQTMFGDLPRFFAGDPDAGIYMAGLYPVMMFALPAIAFAIIKEAREDLKPKIKAMFLTAALGSFLTGVSEPVEFAFLFAAPYVFVIHAILSGFIMWLVYALDIHHGFAYSAGAFDFILNAHLARREIWLIPIGIAYGLFYYHAFRWIIRRFQIRTPGREDETELDDWSGDIPYRAPLVMEALGGKANIARMEACITRLRLTLHDDRLMDISALKTLGAAGVIRLGGGNVQVVFGTYSELLKEQMGRIMRQDFNQVSFFAPVQGRMMKLEEVPDTIFAKGLVGMGVAFFPERGELVSPVAGKVIHLYPTLHAIGIRTKEGLEVLLHIGIDTTQLEGKGFTSYVQIGDEVKPGQLLIRFQLALVRKQAKSLATPMVITNPERVKSWNFAPFKAVKKGQASVMTVVLKGEQANGGKQHG
ncbi:PTS glucose transporter subunit IIA [Xylanibacillus composti]|uniref:Putative PTS system glucosamine-specific EIICBA component n=1 Tax=Xylanibacillus composti TaxID=1572762 RepID=A0A8J4GZX1_9BACL|nr:glucose PTS transporter subunit IIA [Xylanibacillus composti]MDT9724177.1 PTS glucose transporter subunit IIA [Xylanibacillus composti]GIQ68308.1 putative PTS system glucosamine-specific EIICBA component [Xylanibacillus composti]